MKDRLNNRLSGNSRPARHVRSADAFYRAARQAVESLEPRQLFASVGSESTRVLLPASSLAQVASPRALQQPHITLASPQSGTTNVPVDTFISCEVAIPNGAIDAATLIDANVYLTKTGDPTHIPSTLNTSGGGDVIVLKPDASLDISTDYTFHVTSGLADVKGAGFVAKDIAFTTAATVPSNNSSIAFEQVALPTATGHAFSSLLISSGILYAGTLTGEIYRFAINTDGTLGDPTIITTLVDHEGGPRFITGMIFDPSSTTANRKLWISHSATSSLIAGGTQGPDWSGKISLLSGANLDQIDDKVVGLPRSVRDHLTNQLAFGPDGGLYFSQASNSAMGAPDTTWGNRPEHLLNGTILRLDTSKLPSDGPLNVQTEDVATPYDPTAVDAPLTIYADGVRNVYNIVWASNGHLYGPANGSAAGGNTPGDDATGIPALTDVSTPETDVLLDVKKGKYYGHPNPTQGHFVLNGGNPTAKTDPFEVSQYPVGTLPDANYDKPIYDFGYHASPDGALQYANATVFGGALKGKLLVTRYSGGDDIVALTLGAGGKVTKIETGLQGLSHLSNPVDIAEQRSTGFLYVTEFSNSAGTSGDILLLRPTTPSPPTPPPPPVSPPPPPPPPPVSPPPPPPPPVSPPPPPPVASPPPPPPPGPDLQLAIEQAKMALYVPTGEKVSGSVKVRLTNLGVLDLNEKVPVALRLSAGDSPALSDVEIIRTEKKLKLHPGQSKSFTIKFKVLPPVTDGQYHLSAVADPDNAIAEMDETNNAVQTPETYRVAPPTVDISGLFSSTPALLRLNKKETAKFELFNAGNVRLSGKIDVHLIASATPDGASPIDIGTVSLKLKIDPQKSKKYSAKFLIPPSLPAGNYYLLATFDAANVIGESDETNNSAVGGPVSTGA